MLFFMFTLNWTFSMIFMTLNHPLSLGCIVLIQTILVALMSGFMFLNFWFSYILFLVMIGGLLVMFIYMTSIASNEKFNLPKITLILASTSIFSFSTISFFQDNFYSLQLNSMNSMKSFSTLISNLNMSKYFNYPSMLILIFLMIYLLITLIAIVKITDKTNGTLRQK